MRSRSLVVLAVAASLALGAPSAMAAEDVDSVSESNEPLPRSGYGGVIEEIVVTAQFREEGLQDVGLSIAGFDAERIDDLGLVRASDLANFTPSMSVTDRGPNRNDISIRGVGKASALQDLLPTPLQVGTYLDDVSINTLGGSQVDVRFFDLAGVEVLRGPQGSLYGESSTGGTILYRTAEPNLAAFGAKAEIDVNQPRGGGFDSGQRIALNVPLFADRLGFRLVVNRMKQSGFIDRIRPGFEEDNVNGSEIIHQRLTLLAEPFDWLSIRVMRLRDDAQLDAFWLVTQDERDLEHTLRTVNDRVSDVFDLTTAKLTVDTSWLRAVMIFGDLHRKTNRNIYDGITSFVATTVYHPGPDGQTSQGTATDLNETKQQSQELRLVSQFGGPFSFVLGGYHKTFTQLIRGFGEAEEEVAPDIYTGRYDADGEQMSVFGELTWEPTDWLSFTAGLRWHHEDLTLQSSEVTLARFAAIEPYGAVMTVNDLLPMAAVEYRLDDATLLYGRFATGLRNGNINNPVTLALITDPEERAEIESYGPDYVSSWELGFKRSWLDDRLITNGAFFYADWKDIQTNIFVNGLGAVDNLGDARSLGGELELFWNLAERWELFGGFNYIKAGIAESIRLDDERTAEKGTPIPFVPKYGVAGGISYTLPVWNDWTLQLRTSASAVGEYRTFIDSPERMETQPRLGKYALANIGAVLGGKNWDVTLRVANLFDSVPVLTEINWDAAVEATKGEDNVPPENTIAENFIGAPRVLSLTFRYSFGDGVH